MVSGRTGQAGHVAQSHVMKGLDVELVAVITQLPASTVDRVSAPIQRPTRAIYETVPVSLATSVFTAA